MAPVVYRREERESVRVVLRQAAWTRWRKTLLSIHKLAMRAEVPHGELGPIFSRASAGVCSRAVLPRPLPIHHRLAMHLSNLRMQGGGEADVHHAVPKLVHEDVTTGITRICVEVDEVFLTTR
eukprot:scaffold86523_cov31-Tisochrysis_lutea.AAC.3